MLARLLTGVASPLPALPAGPPAGGGAMLSLRLPLELDPPDEDDDPAASSGFAGSAEDACLGSFG